MALSGTINHWHKHTKQNSGKQGSIKQGIAVFICQYLYIRIYALPYYCHNSTGATKLGQGEEKSMKFGI